MWSIPGANGKMTPTMIDTRADLIRSAGMVLCQLELPLETVSHTLAVCADAGVPVMLDPAPAADLPESVWTQVAWFTPNETEATLYAGNSVFARGRSEKPFSDGIAGSGAETRLGGRLCGHRGRRGEVGAGPSASKLSIQWPPATASTAPSQSRCSKAMILGRRRGSLPRPQPSPSRGTGRRLPCQRGRRWRHF